MTRKKGNRRCLREDLSRALVRTLRSEIRIDAIGTSKLPRAKNEGSRLLRRVNERPKITKRSGILLFSFFHRLPVPDPVEERTRSAEAITDIAKSERTGSRSVTFRSRIKLFESWIRFVRSFQNQSMMKRWVSGVPRPLRCESAHS